MSEWEKFSVTLTTELDVLIKRRSGKVFFSRNSVIALLREMALIARAADNEETAFAYEQAAVTFGQVGP